MKSNNKACNYKFKYETVEENHSGTTIFLKRSKTTANGMTATKRRSVASVYVGRIEGFILYSHYRHTVLEFQRLS
jgi:hypothetical protein